MSSKANSAAKREQAIKSYHELEYSSSNKLETTTEESTTEITTDTSVTTTTTTNEENRTKKSRSEHDDISGGHGSPRSNTSSSSIHDVTYRKKEKGIGKLFGHRRSVGGGGGEMMTSAKHDIMTSHDDSFLEICEAAQQGITEHIQQVSEELEKLKKEENENMNAAQSYDYSKKTKHLERMKQKLEFQHSEMKDLREKYIFHKKYKDGADNLKSAISVMTSPKLLDLEKRFEENFLGKFHLKMKGLLGYARLKSGDYYELIVRHGRQKWKSRGCVMSSSLDQNWENFEKVLNPRISQPLSIKVDELGIFGTKRSNVGTASLNLKNLFKLHQNDLKLDLTSTLKLNLLVQWSPFDGYQLTANNSLMTLPTTGTSPISSVGSHPPTTTTPARIHGNVTSHQQPTTFNKIRPIRHITASSARPVTSFFTWTSSANNNNNNNNSNNNNKKRKEVDDKLFSNSSSRSSKSFAPPLVIRSTPTTDELFMSIFQREVDNLDLHEELPDEVTPKPKKEEYVSQMTDRQRQLAEILTTLMLKINKKMENIRGSYKELKFFENCLFELNGLLEFRVCDFEQELGGKFDEISRNHFLPDDEDDVTTSYDVNFQKMLNRRLLTTGSPPCDQALIPHLHIVLGCFKKIGVFGPLRIGEVRSFDKLHRQAKIFKKIVGISKTKQDLTYENLGEFENRRELLEFWKSCCHGDFSLVTSGKLLRLEFQLGFGAEVGSRHHDVSQRVFPELVRRICRNEGQNDVDSDDVIADNDLDTRDVTLFQLNDYVGNALEVDGCDVTLGKLIDLLAYEMFINTALSSGKTSFVLMAIKRLSSLLAMRMSNLRNLSKLLLDGDESLRNAAAAHIKHLKTEHVLREKAIISYAEILESENKFDRQAACLALGFLSADQIITQLSYLIQTDIDPDVRKTASNVLLSFGEDGEEAREDAESSLLTQTMIQQQISKFHNNPITRLGTAL